MAFENSRLIINVMESEQKIKLEGLQVGMYVSKIDRPWSEIPVAFEGLMIKTNDEIDTIKKYCEYVYIDSSRGRAASPMYWLKDKGQIEESVIVDRGQNEFEILRQEEYEVISGLGDEIDVAKDIYRTVNENITETFEELRLSKKLNLDRLNDSVVSTVDSVIRNPTAFKLLLEFQHGDDYSYNHALRCSVWCAQFGRHLGFSHNDINELALGGLLMDIGKTQIAVELLNKTETLTQSEIALFRSHVDNGVRILAESEDVPHTVLQMVATHHERANAGGYPQSLENEEIPVFGRIGGIVDSFDAMTCDRPFRERPYSPHEAIHDLYRLRGIAFHKDLVEQFIQTIGVYPAGSLIELRSGQVGMVVGINNTARLRPKVMIVLDEKKQPLENYYPLDLSEHEDLSIRRALDHSAYGIKMNELFLANICEFFA